MCYDNLPPASYYPTACLFYGEVQITLNPYATLDKKHWIENPQATITGGPPKQLKTYASLAQTIAMKHSRETVEQKKKAKVKDFYSNLLNKKKKSKDEWI